MQQVITMLGEAEAEDLLQEKNIIDVRCEFCNSNYAFDAIDVTLLFRK